MGQIRDSYHQKDGISLKSSEESLGLRFFSVLTSGHNVLHKTLSSIQQTSTSEMESVNLGQCFTGALRVFICLLIK